MNVKSQSELDIGGRETCNCLFWSSLLDILEIDSQAYPSWLWGTCCGSKDGWYTPGCRRVTDEKRDTISATFIKQGSQGYPYSPGDGLLHYTKLSSIFLSNKLSRRKGVSDLCLRAWQLAVPDVHALPPDPVADHLVPEQAGRERGLGLPLLLNVHIWNCVNKLYLIPTMTWPLGYAGSLCLMMSSPRSSSASFTRKSFKALKMCKLLYGI